MGVTMHGSGKESGFSACLGLVAALLVPACAWAQGDWQSPTSTQGSLVQGYAPLTLSSPSAAGQPRQLAAPPSKLGPAAGPMRDFNVRRADYNAITEDPSSEAAKPGFLPRRSAPSQTNHGSVKGLNQLWTTGAALALVLGLFCVVAWIMRRAVPRTSLPLPADVVETLGRAPLAGRQYVHLIRCGRKLLLVNVTADSAKTLTEITDPAEVDRLAGLCDPTRSPRATAAFRQVFDQFNHPSRQRSADERGISAGSLYDDGDSFREGRDV